MPELPEIEILKDEVNNALSGRRIVDVEVSSQGIINLPKKEFEVSLLNRSLSCADRRGKMLILNLLDGDCLLVHLMLFGQIRLAKETAGSQVALGFDNQMWLTFSRLALGAGVHLYHEKVDEIPRIAQLGTDALSLSQNKFRKIVLSRKGKIKSILMNQKLIAGIGNTYADEMLFRARVHPERMARSLKEEEIDSIYKQVKGVLEEAILRGGAISEEFAHLDGSKGGFTPQIHGRQGEPCSICNTRIRKTIIGGRATNYCPNCQKYFVKELSLQ